MYRSLFIRVVVLIALIAQGVLAYQLVGVDDFLPFRVIYAGTVVFHAVHAWQKYTYEKQVRAWHEEVRQSERSAHSSMEP